MNICIVTEYFPNPDGTGAHGGVETRAWYLAIELGRGHNVSIVTSYQGPHQRQVEKADGVTLYRVGPTHSYTSEGAIFSRLRFAFSVYGFLSSPSVRYDVVDAQCFIPYLPSFYGARRHHIVCISTWQEVWGRQWIRNKGFVTGLLGYLWERLSLTVRWDAIITPTMYTATLIHSRIASRTPVYVLPNGIDAKAIKLVAAGPRVPFSICCVGRLVSTKRITTLVRALSHLKSTEIDLYRRLTCNIVGTGPCEDELRRLSQRLGCADKIRFLGTFKDQNDVIKLIKESALLVHPSVVEGFGLVLAEAAACDTPFIASDIPVLREVRDLLGWGELFPPDDHRALAAAISSNLRRNYASRKQPRVDQLDWPSVAAQIEQVYLNSIRHKSNEVGS